MKTIRRLIYGEVLASIAFVAAGFLALFFFFDLVDELQYLGKNAAGALSSDDNTYQIRHALLYVALLIPSHLYELVPISVLIGAIFVMARLAQSSEYTILRTSGLEPWRALRLLLLLGAFFTVLCFAVGDYVAPAADRSAQLLKARYQGRISIGQTGAWLKEKQTHTSYVVNVNSLSSDNEMHGVRVFEFDSKGLLISITQSELARFGSDDAWVLENGTRTEFTVKEGNAQSQHAARDSATITINKVENFRWPTDISAEMVSVAVLKPDRMSTIDLFSYIRHLNANGQTTQRYEIEFWKKVFYPLSCLVMVVMALPFAYLHFRSGGIAGYVFGGVMIGISFFLLNNVFGYIGNLQSWQPWLAAAAPGLLYSAISLAAFGWLVLRR
jgi:lipopolysaccharide export system permease protein